MKNEKKALPYGIIMSAISGDAQAVNYVLEYYTPYIEELCKRKIKLADGESMTKWVSFMKLRIRAKLIEKIVKFKDSFTQINRFYPFPFRRNQRIAH